MPWDQLTVPENGSILALLGSPRDGNTTQAMRDVISGLGVPVQLWDLDQNPVPPIGDCAVCQRQNRCTRREAFNEIYPVLLASPLILVGTPLYWYGVSAQAKALLDRFSCGLATDPQRFRARMRGKGLALISPQADPDLRIGEPLVDSMRLTCEYLGMHYLGALQPIAHSRHDVRDDARARREAWNFGRQLRSFLGD